MAIHMLPLLGSSAERPSFAEPVVFVTECHHVQHTDGGDEADHFRSMALLVSLSTTQADRAALRPLRHALAFGRCTEFGGVKWPERLAKRVAALQPEFATAIVFVGSADTIVVDTVQAAIDTVHRLLGSALALVVVVSAVGSSLVPLTGVTGFVCGVIRTDGDTARQVFLALSALLAPEALNGIDILDVLPALGPSSAPTVLAAAIWLREGDGRLVFPSHADKSAVGIANGVVAVPFIRGCGWDELGRFRTRLCEDAHGSTSPVVFATGNALNPELFPSGVGWAPILCSMPE